MDCRVSPVTDGSSRVVKALIHIDELGIGNVNPAGGNYYGVAAGDLHTGPMKNLGLRLVV
jgi:hypothetical protein